MFTAATGLFYRKPASVIRSGDEIAALSWIMADEFGQGSWELYPMTFSISFENGSTVAVVGGCLETSLPDDLLPGNIPFPVEYSRRDDLLIIRFSEVPHGEVII